MVITRLLMVMARSFFLSMTLKEELPGWECGEAKQEVQPQFELSLTQLSPSLFVVISPYWEKCNPESLWPIAPLWEYHGPDFLPYGNLSSICVGPDWPWPWVLWPVTCVCCMSDIISQIKGTRAVDITSVWRDIMGWLPMVMVTCGNGDLWWLCQYCWLSTVWPSRHWYGWGALTYASTTQALTRWSGGARGESFQRMTLAKAVSSEKYVIITIFSLL